MAKIWVEAYGCSASFSDSEMISGLIVNSGHQLAQNSSESDLNLVVTCSVKDATANKMIHRIKKLKTKPLIVAGCLPKAEKNTVMKISPTASMLGPNSLGKTIEVIDSTLRGKQKIMLEDIDGQKLGIPKIRLNPTVGIVEIASGCMSECTFCQTKLSKGDLRSYRIGDIVRQVKQEIADGCKEIWLTSTDNGCYGLDIGTTLPELIKSISQISGDFKIRVGMMNPMYMPRISDDLLDAYESDKVFKFLHVPVQSGSDNVLNDMKRGHTAKTFKEISKKFKSKFENFTISTDVIVGYPSETSDDFDKTVDLLKQTRPDIVNISKYSQRPGTEAASMIQIQTSEVKRRSKIIFEIANQISLKNNKKWIGWEGPALFDESTEQGIKGRNFAYKPIFVKERVSIGKSHQVKVIDTTNHSLVAEITS